MKKTIFLLTLVTTALPAWSRGPMGSSLVGLDIKTLAAPAANTILFGWRYLHHPSKEFSLGGVGYLGQSTGNNNGSLAYGGLYASWNAPMHPKATLELGLLAGGAGGVLASGVTYGGVCLEPTLTFSFGLGPNVGMAVNTGYLYIPTATTGSGITMGIRFEFLFDEPTPSTTSSSGSRPSVSVAPAPTGATSN